ncbi:MAG: hypothetical protein G01um10142_138 [Parcubacteria group bacterium Gr01-1014_2]|nr:MAG: hypothetical protein G01um10142_138 [Parcubacteria group bacterium Gr01-1014_2]
MRTAKFLPLGVAVTMSLLIIYLYLKLDVTSYIWFLVENLPAWALLFVILCGLGLIVWLWRESASYDS